MAPNQTTSVSNTVQIKQEGAKRKRVDCDDVESVPKDPPRLSQSTNGDGNEDVAVLGATGPNALADYPHSRADCVVVNDPQQYCDNCYCFVCDIKAGECSHWDEHYEAKAGINEWEVKRLDRQTKERKDIGDIPEGLFDYYSEWRASSMPFKELNDKAQQIKFVYDDDETFLAALEIYNRQSFRINKGYFRHYGIQGAHADLWDLRHHFKKQEVRGRHRTPCWQCGHTFTQWNSQFQWSGECYVRDMSQFIGGDKVCMGCMERTLCFWYGHDKARIKNLLEQWRQKTRMIYHTQWAFSSNEPSEPFMDDKPKGKLPPPP